MVEKVIADHRPVCLKSDWMNLVEDVGGLSGFVEFLITSIAPNNKRSKSSNEWAAKRGRSRRKTSANPKHFSGCFFWHYVL